MISFCFRPGYESVQTPRVHPPAVSSSPTNIQATPPISTAGGSGSNSPNATTPFPPQSSSSSSSGGQTGLTRVASTRGSPTQEQLTEPSVGMGGASSSAAQSGSNSGGSSGGTNAQNADSSHSRPQSGNSSGNNVPSRSGSIIQQRRERRMIVGAPLTRQQHYLSRNYLHHDLQLPDGYGERG